jgi:hypothetical protein
MISSLKLVFDAIQKLIREEETHWLSDWSQEVINSALFRKGDSPKLVCASPTAQKSIFRSVLAIRISFYTFAAH